MTSSRAQRRKRRKRLEILRFLACAVLAYAYLRDLALAVHQPTGWSIGAATADLAALAFLLFVPINVSAEVGSAR